MAEYKHGTYGNFADSIGAVATQSGTLPVYIGVAPVNLVRGYSAKVNTPIKLSNMDDVKRNFGYSRTWDSFDLCEAFKVHFDNDSGNIGPIVAINVLDPATHKKSTETSMTLNFANGAAYINSDTIILDSLALEDKVEGTDYAVEYDFTRSRAVITSIGSTTITGTVDATYSEVETTAVSSDDITGGVTSGGVYTGLGCVQLVYQMIGRIPNLILCPGWSGNKDVYAAMVKAGTKINGHWDAFVYADIPVLDGSTKVDTIDSAKTWKNTNGFNSERSKVFWPQAKDTDGNIFHASVLAAWRTLLVDESHSSVPMETPSNKVVPVSAQYFGTGSANRGFDQQTANTLNAEGITTIVFWGGVWVLWGPHTAAYNFGDISDNRNIFDNSIRMMMYISNSFQAEHALTIDQPMTRAMSDTIRNIEQEKADALAAIGALIGKPVVEFRESENSTADLVEGNFTWSFKGTPTPPFKSGTLNVAYSTDGFNSYLGEVE